MTELPRKNISLLIPLLGISVSFVLLWLADMRSHRESLVWGEMKWDGGCLSVVGQDKATPRVWDQGRSPRPLMVQSG